MSLRVWLPLNGNLNNQGLDQVTVTNSGAVVDNNGKIGKCYSFDGSNDKIQISNAPTPTDISVAMWFKRKITTNTRQFLYTQWQGITLELDALNKIICSVYSNGSQRGYCKTDDTITADSGWVHICFIFKNGTGTKLYINGLQVSYAQLSTPITWGTTIGNIGYFATYLNACVNDFRIYDHALSPLEVKQISQGLILHYPLNRNGWGNENLHKNSDTITSTWSINQGTVSNGVATITPSSGSDRRIYQMPANGGWNWESNKTYTASIDARSPNGAILIFYPYGAGSMNKSYTVTSQWKRYSFTFTATQSGTGSMTYHVNQTSGVTLQLKHPKLELGQKATSWCPNSLDKLYNTLGLNNNIQYDTSGYGNNGTKIGTFNYDSDTPKYNVSTSFNGSAKIERDSLMGEVYTLSCWAKTIKNKSTSQMMVVDSNSQIGIAFYNGTIIGVYGSTTRSTGSKSTLNGSNYKENEWNHFVVVKTSNDGKRNIYCNGELLTPVSDDYWSSASNNFGIGARNTSTPCYFYGEISDVRAYVTALSADDVKSLYQNSAYIDNQGNIYGAVYEEV